MLPSLRDPRTNPVHKIYAIKIKTLNLSNHAGDIFFLYESKSSPNKPKLFAMNICIS
jgi:hypothetical protein